MCAGRSNFEVQSLCHGGPRVSGSDAGRVGGRGVKRRPTWPQQVGLVRKASHREPCPGVEGGLSLCAEPTLRMPALGLSYERLMRTRLVRGALGGTRHRAWMPGLSWLADAFALASAAFQNTVWGGNDKHAGKPHAACVFKPAQWERLALDLTGRGGQEVRCMRVLTGSGLSAAKDGSDPGRAGGRGCPGCRSSTAGSGTWAGVRRERIRC